jgi:hypothetical protein
LRSQADCKKQKKGARLNKIQSQEKGQKTTEQKQNKNRTKTEQKQNKNRTKGQSLCLHKVSCAKWWEYLSEFCVK